MSCTAASFETTIAANNLWSLSDRDALMVLAAIYGASVALTAKTALALAYQDGLPALSDRQLDEAMLASIC